MMLNQMKRWLEPPDFEGDEERTSKTRIASTLIIYLGAALLIVIFILIPLFAIQKIGSWILSITMFGVLAIGRHILIKGNFRQGTILIFSVIYLCILAILILSGGSSSTAMFYLATVVLVAGFFLEARLVNGLTIATFLVAMGISFLQDWGLVMIPEVFVFNSVFSWIATGVGLLLMVRARELFVGNLNNALSQARQEVAARQQAEDVLKSSLSLLQASLESTADGILVVNSAGNITKWNQKFAEMWKLSEEILSTQNDTTVIGQILSQLSDPQQFLDSVKCLYAQPAESSVDQVEFLDGRIFERYSQPQRIDTKIVGRVWSFRDVTERKRIIESLTASETRYRLLANNVPDIIYSLDEIGNIVTINKLAFDRYGYHEQDAKGKPFLAFIHPEDRENVIRSFIKAAEEQRELTRGLQFRIMAENGSIYWFELNSRAHFDQNGRYIGEDGVLRDITERKLAEEALQESEQRYRTLFQQASDGIFYLSTDGKVVTVNKSFAKMHGYSMEEMQGMSLQDLDTPENANKISERMRRVMAGEVIEFEVEHYHKDGHVFPLSVSTGLISLGSQQLIQAFHRDITERKRAEVALRESQELLALFMQHSPIYTYIKAVSPTEDRLLQASENMRELIGISSDQAIVGRTMEELFPPDFAAKISADDRAVVARGEVLKLDEDLNDRHYTTIKFPLVQAGKTLLAGYTIDITERKQAELALLEAQTLTNAIVDSTSDLIWSVDPENFGLLTFNFGLRNYFIKGREMQIEVGMRPEELFPPGEFVQKWREFYQRALMDGSYTIEYITCAGTVTLQLTFNLLKHDDEVFGISVFGRDITESKQAEDALRESKDQMEMAQTIGHTGSWVYNLETGKIWGTIEAHRIFGFASVAGDFLLEDIEACILERERVHQALVALISEGREYDLEYAINPADGSPARVIHSIARLEKDAQGKPIKVSGFIQDITELKRAEEDRIAREIAEQANRAKSEFISRMSHELRTPLNAILGFSQLLKMDELKPNQARGADQIYRSGRHLLNLVNQVLDIARIESGKLHILPEPMRLADTLQEALELIRPLAEARRLSLSLEIPSSSDIFVQADHQSLKQVLLNLLSNAVKYNREGGQIAITASLSIDGHLRLQVRDTGEGIPLDKMERLFTPFDRLDRDSIEQEGTGLGLAVSKGLVEAMGGRIGAQSQPGQGSIFWLELDLVSERLKETILAEVDEHLSNRLRAGRGLVLYVEDNLANVQLVEAIMERLPQVQLITTMQGRLALDLAQEHHPDLILLDLHLPDMPGSEVLRRLKAEPATKNISVIILSANTLTGQIAELLAGEVRAYLTKPIDIQEFLKVVEDSLADPLAPGKKPDRRASSQEE
jgi:PAS domain S-box-containing protein